MSVLERIVALLESAGARFDILRHAPVYTSQQAAEVRQTTLSSGAKALVCKVDDRFVMLVMPADRRLDSKAARKAFGFKSIRFATGDEVLGLTQLTPGSIPPFGQLFGLATYCDQRLADEPTINFNAGVHALSISMAYADYARIEQPTMGQFAELAPS
jgi:Ala-tRNA(Pro) deacylase